MRVQPKLAYRVFIGDLHFFQQFYFVAGDLLVRRIFRKFLIPCVSTVAESFVLTPILLSKIFHVFWPPVHVVRRNDK